MSPPCRRFTLVVLLCSSLHSVVLAQSVSVEVKAQAAPDSPPPGAHGGSHFSIGAGIGWASDTGSGLGTPAVSSNVGAFNPTYAPVVTALLEYAATRSLRLMLGLNGSYTNRLRESQYQPPNARVSERWGVGVGVGMRWVLNPGGSVEVSPVLLLGLRRGHMDTWGSAQARDPETGAYESYPTHAETGSFGLDARLGMILERLLLENLYVRLESYLLRAGSDSYSEIVRAGDGPDERSSYTDFGLGWGLAVSLQLRLTF